MLFRSPGEDCIEMVINRIIDNASVAIASFNRKAVITPMDLIVLAICFMRITEVEYTTKA